MIPKQKQHLLAYLGYYGGNVDGIWGDQSRAATEAFQRDYQIEADGVFGDETFQRIREVIYEQEPPSPLPAHDQEQTTDTDDWWQNIRYWSRKEFACRCGEYHAPYCDGFPVEPDRTLVELADDVRAHFGRPAHRSSGIRCTQHNIDSKGVSNSKHLYGKALDFFVEGVSGAQLLAYVQTDPRVNYAYIIEGQYVHMDVD